MSVSENGRAAGAAQRVGVSGGKGHEIILSAQQEAT